MLRSDELQTKLDELFDTFVAKLHCVVRGTTARYGPKFEPVTLMLLRCCEVTEDGEGVLKLNAGRINVAFRFGNVTTRLVFSSGAPLLMRS